MAVVKKPSKSEQAKIVLWFDSRRELIKRGEVSIPEIIEAMTKITGHDHQLSTIRNWGTAVHEDLKPFLYVRHSGKERTEHLLRLVLHLYAELGHPVPEWFSLNGRQVGE